MATTVTSQSKSEIIGQFELPQPVLGTVTLPFPSRASIKRIDHMGTVITLMGKERRDILGKKYQYQMEWEVLSPTYYNALEDIIATGNPTVFTYQKWPQSNMVYVLGQLTERTHVAGTGTTEYWSSVSLTLTEVYPR